jgi:hypothetical protein
VTLNFVCLLGWVAEPPRATDADSPTDGVQLTVATRGPGPEDSVLRHRVLAVRRAAEAPRDLATGQPVYVEGRLITATTTDASGRRRRRVDVVVHTLWPFDVPLPLPTPPLESPRTHASPHPHTRVGHWRRVAPRPPGERLVWVRATTVGPTLARGHHDSEVP